MEKYIHIGKTTVAFGVKGELLVQHSLGKKTSFSQVEAVFIEKQKGKYLPYFLQQAKGRTAEESIIKLEGIDNKETATLLANKPLWLLEVDFRRLAGKQSAIALLGYTIFDKKEFIGEVLEVIEQPHQILLTVLYKGNEAYIPLHEDSLQKIDHAKKEVHVLLPDGLLDLYG